MVFPHPLLLHLLFTIFSTHCTPTTAPAIEPLPLEGHSLICCAFPFFPLLRYAPTRKPYLLDGEAANYLENLQARLGFRCSTMNVFPSTYSNDDVFFRKIQKCHRNEYPQTRKVCKCQLGVGWWPMTSKTVHMMRFLPYYIADEVVAIRRRSPNRNPLFFAMVFEPGVIAFVILVLVTIAMLDHFLKHVEENDYDNEDTPEDTHGLFRAAVSTSQAVGEAVFRYYGTFLGSGDSENSKSRLQLLLATLVLTVGLFMAQAYGALLPGFLEEDNSILKYSVVDEVESCRLKQDDICAVRGPLMSGAIQRLSSSSSCPGDHGRSPLMFDSVEKAVESLRTSRCSTVLASRLQSTRVFSGEFCSELKVSGEPIVAVGGSFVFPPNTNYDVFMGFEKATLELREQGFIRSQRTLVSEHHCRARKPQPLGVYDLRGFIALVVLVLFSLSLFILMKYLRKKSRPTKNRDEPARPPEEPT